MVVFVAVPDNDPSGTQLMLSVMGCQRDTLLRRASRGELGRCIRRIWVACCSIDTIKQVNLRLPVSLDESGVINIAKEGRKSLRLFVLGCPG